MKRSKKLKQVFYKFKNSEDLFGCEIEIQLVFENVGGDEKIQNFNRIRQFGEEILEKCFIEARRIHNEYSRFIEGNKLSKFNSRLNQWQEIDEEFFYLLSFAMEVAEKTDGAFDLTVKNLLESWGYDSKYSLKAKKIEESKLGKGKIFLQKSSAKITKQIDLGGLGKGYLLDQLVKIIEKFSKDNFLEFKQEIFGYAINAGGDIYAKGKNNLESEKFSEEKIEVQNWRMAFEHPTNIQQAIGFVEVDSFFVASSSPLRRNWKIENNLSRHHLVENHLERPANQMAAVYVQAEKGIIADAYATALFVLGFEKAKDFLGELNESQENAIEKSKNLKLEAMLVSKSGKIWRSKGFQGKLFKKN